MKICTREKNPLDMQPVGNVAYGEVVQMGPTTYIKAQKRKAGQGINIDPLDASGMSMLFNPKIGSTRLIPGDTLVKVLRSELCVSPVETGADLGQVLKEGC